MYADDASRKTAIIELVTNAAGSGATLTACGSPVTGPLSLEQIRSALGVNSSEALRLVNACIDDEDIAVVKAGDSQPNSWRFEPAA
jgi:hypothetical protein